MINLAWDLYDGATHRFECAEILALSFMVIILHKFSKIML